MKLYSIHAIQHLPISLEEGWRFFSDPYNLATITPPWLDFRLLATLPEAIYPGMIIPYRIRPLYGLPVRWITEITQVQKFTLFVDEQRFGPYRFWHHQHHFRKREGGVVVEDIVHYALPLGLCGRIVHALLIQKRLKEIFAFRCQVLKQRFSIPSGHEQHAKQIFR